jgi:hypothetical protein
MAGEKKIIEMHLEYGVHHATSDSSGTGTKLGPIRSAEYDSSVPLELVKAQAEALGNLAIDLSNNAVPSTLKDQFFVELASHFRLARARSHESPGGTDSKRDTAGILGFY